MTKDKKKTIIFTVALAIIALILIICFVFIELRKEGIIGSSESNVIVEEFNKNYNAKERKVIFYASSTCGYCDLQKPVLETIAEDYDVEYYSIDASLLSNSQRNEIIEKLDIEGATPTIAIVEKGKVVATQVGYTDGSGLVSFFKKNKIVPKDAVYSKEKYITFISYEEYEDLIDSSKTNIITIGQTSCSHCTAFKPAINAVAEDYELTMNYLNLTELTEEESNDFFESLEDIEYNDPNFVEKGEFGTPLTLVVKNGKVKHYISGERTVSQLVRELKKAGIISEDE